MQEEDEVFADIVQQEFDEHWAPDTPAASDQPQPDFHLNLYDDDESYRQVPASGRALSIPSRWGLGLVGLGLLITVARFAQWHLPAWSGWVGVGCFAAGVSVGLWQLTRRRRPDQDEEGIV